MRFNKAKTSEILEGDLTPMIDMTFQLIAFFMLLINFSEVDQAEEITLPVAVLAIPPDAPPDYQIILNLEPEGEVIFAGKRFDLDSLGRELEFEVSSAAREGVYNPGDISVVIRAHKNTQTGTVQKLISICQSEKLESFALRVLNKAN